jgi:hypothetical protein
MSSFYSVMIDRTEHKEISEQTSYSIDTFDPDEKLEDVCCSSSVREEEKLLDPWFKRIRDRGRHRGRARAISLLPMDCSRLFAGVIMPVPADSASSTA